MRPECYAASRPQEGRSANEDAFLIRHGPVPCVALCDGAGNAQRAAKRVLTLFEKLFQDSKPEQIADERVWGGWIKLLDSSLLGGAQSTATASACPAEYGQPAEHWCALGERSAIVLADPQSLAVDCRSILGECASRRSG